MLVKTFHNMERRVQACLDANGEHFQHLLWLPRVCKLRPCQISLNYVNYFKSCKKNFGANSEWNILYNWLSRLLSVTKRNKDSYFPCLGQRQNMSNQSLGSGGVNWRVGITRKVLLGSVDNEWHNKEAGWFTGLVIRTPFEAANTFTSEHKFLSADPSDRAV
jgi:hypothetical protein